MVDEASDELLVTYTLFPNTGAHTKTERVDRPWSELVANIRDAPTYIDKAHCPLISLADYGDKLSPQGCIRHDENVTHVYGIEIDYDAEAVTPEQARTLLHQARLRGVLYTSPSHKPDRPRWRILFPLSEPAAPAQKLEYIGRANRALGGIAASESFDLSRSYYIGRVRGAEYEVIETFGRTLDAASDLEPLYPSGRGSDGKKPRDMTTDAELRACFERGEGRYEAMLKLSARWASRGMAADDIDATLVELLGANPFNAEGVDLRTRIRGMVDGAMAKWHDTRTPKADVPRETLDDSDLRPFAPPEAYVDPAPHAVTDEGPLEPDDEKPKREPLRWDDLDGKRAPEREWAIDHWLPMGHVTLLAGAAGAGKTLLAQALASCVCLQREYLDYVPQPRRVLMWACEDEHDELWRRQEAIAKALNVPLASFDDKLVMFSYHGKLVEIAGLEQQKLQIQRGYTELRDQIGDYKADVVILDNVARLYGGNENDRHQVTNFIAMLTNAARSTNAAVLLLGHPSKAIGSEYSGSTAWEGAVRARLYLGRKLPDEERKGAEDEDAPEDETLRFLCRRKANYSSRDVRKLHYTDGVMVAEPPPAITGYAGTASDYAEDVVRRALAQIIGMGEQANSSRGSPSFFPKLAKQYALLERLTYKQFLGTMHGMRKNGGLKVAEVGTNANRTPKLAFVIP